ncbi:MAG: hypothetical protein FJX42_12300, partial [Alphaproteobacteria bacterium]|nr:hypothetical protein [Alphaproteobacteria bacterium]
MRTRPRKPPTQRKTPPRKPPRHRARPRRSVPGGRPAMEAAALRARVLYRDPMVLVIDKPAGVAVHAGPGGGTNIEDSFEALRFEHPRP